MTLGVGGLSDTEWHRLKEIKQWFLVWCPNDPMPRDMGRWLLDRLERVAEAIVKTPASADPDPMWEVSPSEHLRKKRMAPGSERDVNAESVKGGEHHRVRHSLSVQSVSQPAPDLTPPPGWLAWTGPGAGVEIVKGWEQFFRVRGIGFWTGVEGTWVERRLT